jgi:ribonucleoside-diphosphate reductase alpha chain
MRRHGRGAQALIAEHGHPQRAADLDRAHGHDQPLCGQRVSSGIEPIFAYAYTRKVLQPDGTRTEEEVVDYAVQMWRDLLATPTCRSIS